MRRILAGIAVLGLLPAHATTAQQAPVLRSGAAEITVGGRVHAQFTTSSADSVPLQEWVLRRVRLESSVAVNDWIGGKVQLDFAGDRVSVKDAYLTLEFDRALQVTVGNQHRPFGTITGTSSNRVLVAERGMRIRGVDGAYEQHKLVAGLGYADRDLGLRVSGTPAGAPLGLFYAVGYFNGPARDADVTGDTYQLAGRLGVRPAADVAVAGSFSRRDFVLDGTTRAGLAWALDAEIGSYAPGFHFVGEAVLGDFDPHAGAEFAGAQVWLAYRTPALGGRITHVEPAIRVSHGDPDRAHGQDVATGGLLVTPGVNLYLGGMNRIMVNADFWRGDDGSRATGFRTQFQLAF